METSRSSRYLPGAPAEPYAAAPAGLLQQFFISCPDPIIGCAPDAVITFWNPAAEQVFGLPAEEAIGQPFALLAPPGGMAALDHWLSLVHEGQTVTTIETVRRASDGRLLETSLTLFPMRDEHGQSAGFAAVARDVSPRGQAAHVPEAESSRASLIHPKSAPAGPASAQEPLAGVLPTLAQVLERTGVLPAEDAGWHGTTMAQHAEQGQRHLERRFQTLVEQLPAAIYVHADDADETMLYLSPHCATLLGYERTGDVPFQTRSAWLDQVHPDDLDRVLRDLDAQAPAQNFRMLEYRLRRADGAYLWVNDGYEAICNEAGERVAWVGVLIDITERRQADDLASRLAAVVTTSDDAISTRTPDGRITYWNPAAEKLYGYTPEEIIGQSVTVLFPEGDNRHVTLPDEFGDAPALHFETRDRRRDGSLVDVAATISLVRDAAGEVTAVSAIARDITERKEAERALRAALDAAEAGEQAKARFLAMMSHELRTPLQAVLGYADFLLSGRQGKLTPEQHEDITYIHLGASRMVTLIEQILDLSRMEAGQLALRCEPVDVPAVMELVRQDIAPQAGAKGLQVRLIAPARLPQALGDPDRIRQILLNLAGNAVKYTEAGAITLQARCRQGWLEVAVIDTGIGIASADLPGIFDEFRQVDGNLTRRYGGAGLGLAIARRLAEQMGGAIVVSSTPGAGSTFTLRLPVVAPDPPASGAERPA